jgi:hypothetical protein
VVFWKGEKVSRFVAVLFIALGSWLPPCSKNNIIVVDEEIYA